jgi:ribonuclease I
MKVFLIILYTIAAVVAWDYLLFVQVWPGSWINDDHTNNTFNNSYFTIHGIWPEYYNNSWPQYCTHEHFNFTAIAPIHRQLEQLWTDFKNPRAFWVHEFTKHATCAEDDPLLATEFTFFATGLALRNKYNLFAILNNSSIVPSNQVKYPTSKVEDVLNVALGYQIVLVCDENDILNEIRVCLDRNLAPFDCPQSEIKSAGCTLPYIIMNSV